MLRSCVTAEVTTYDDQSHEEEEEEEEEEEHRGQGVGRKYASEGLKSGECGDEGLERVRG